MPIYEYVCGHCKRAYEKTQKMGARAPRKCPECGGKARQHRQVSGAALRFKGPGFYVNDYPQNKKRR